MQATQTRHQVDGGEQEATVLPNHLPLFPLTSSALPYLLLPHATLGSSPSPDEWLPACVIKQLEPLGQVQAGCPFQSGPVVPVRTCQHWMAQSTFLIM